MNMEDIQIQSATVDRNTIGVLDQWGIWSHFKPHHKGYFTFVLKLPPQ